MKSNVVFFVDYIGSPTSKDLEPLLEKVSSILSSHGYGLQIKPLKNTSPTLSGPSSVQECEKLFENNIHLIRCCVPSYFQLESQLIPLVTPLMKHNKNQINNPTYYTVFITKKSLKITDSIKYFKNIANHNNLNPDRNRNRNDNDNHTNNSRKKLTLVVNEMDSSSGIKLLMSLLAENELNINDIFNKIIISGSHKNSMMLIKNGIGDIATIDINVLMQQIGNSSSSLFDIDIDIDVISNKHGLNINSGYAYRFNFIEKNGFIDGLHSPSIFISKKFVNDINIMLRCKKEDNNKCNKNDYYHDNDQKDNGDDHDDDDLLSISIEKIQDAFIKASVEDKNINNYLKKKFNITQFVKCNVSNMKNLKNKIRNMSCCKYVDVTDIPIEYHPCTRTTWNQLNAKL